MKLPYFYRLSAKQYSIFTQQPVLYNNESNLSYTNSPESLAYKVFTLQKTWKTNLDWVKQAHNDRSERWINPADIQNIGIFRKKVARMRENDEE